MNKNQEKTTQATACGIHHKKIAQLTGSDRKREKHVAMPEGQKHAHGTAETTTRHASVLNQKSPKRRATRAVIEHGELKLDVESGKRPTVLDIKLQQLTPGVVCAGQEAPRYRQN